MLDHRRIMVYIVIYHDIYIYVYTYIYIYIYIFTEGYTWNKNCNLVKNLCFLLGYENLMGQQYCFLLYCEQILSRFSSLLWTTTHFYYVVRRFTAVMLHRYVQFPDGNRRTMGYNGISKGPLSKYVCTYIREYGTWISLI